MTAFLAQQDVEVMRWPARSPDMNPIEHYGPRRGLDPRHGWSPFHCAKYWALWAQKGSGSETWMIPLSLCQIVACCPPGLGCRSDKKGDDPGGEHTMSCGCSSRCQRGSRKVLVVWGYGCKHVWAIIKKHGQMPFGFRSWRHYSNALFLHCGCLKTLLCFFYQLQSQFEIGS